MQKRLIVGTLGLGLALGYLVARPLVASRSLAGGPDAAILAGLRLPAVAAMQQTAPADKKLAADPEDANVAFVVARLLARYHYDHHPIDAETSSRLLDRYLDTLDPLHFYFTKADMDEFEPMRKTIGPQLWDKGDTSAANRIFVRFLERFDQHVAYVNELLKTEEFSFNTNDTFLLDRKKSARPASMDEAKSIWRDRLRYEYLQEKLNKQSAAEIVKTLTRRYERTKRSIHEMDHDDIFEFFLSSLGHVYDPHSAYMGKASRDNFDISMKLSVVGIGATLTSEDGYAKITEVVPGGPAAKSGKIKVGDRVVAVAQGTKEPVDTVDMKLDKVVEMIRGQKGTEVRLTIIPADAADPSVRKVITIVRDEVKLEAQEAKAKVIDIPDATGKTSRIAIIDVPSFYEDTERRGAGGKSTTNDVKRLLTKLQTEKVAGVILDLSRNPGGSLTEAIRLSGLFIKDGPVVQVRDSNGKVSVDDDPDKSIVYAGPLIVLTSQMSASASEILAGALQDYGRAVVVGDASTHGKGTVQTVIPLSEIFQDRGVKLSHDPGALKVTIQKFYRPSGSSTQLKGVVPDIIVPSVTSRLEIGEKSLDNPLSWDTVPTSSFAKLNTVAPYLNELRKRSTERISTDKSFTYLNEAIAQRVKVQTEKTVSLNEQQRMKEKQEAQARADALKKELKAAANTNEKVYELTLRQVDTPGLPAPAKTTAPKPTSATADPDDTVVPGDPTTTDITLREAKRILLDLVSLSAKVPGTAAVRR